MQSCKSSEAGTEGSESVADQQLSESQHATTRAGQPKVNHLCCIVIVQVCMWIENGSIADT